MSVYPIFKNEKNKTLVYYCCPKNGNTSAKMFFAKHLNIENKFYFFEDELPKYKKKQAEKIIHKNYKGKTNLVNIFPNYQKFDNVKADEKCCIVRDPFERFISAYRNRILYHQDENFYKHSIDMILNKLENNKFENKHFLPQTYFLGKNINYYTIYSNLNKIADFEKKINDFFNKNISFPRLQTRGKDLEIILNKKQKEKIEKIYEDDFIFLNNNDI